MKSFCIIELLHILIFLPCQSVYPVSYTHLDVYKRQDETYSFVNLTRERICSSRFKTIEEAIHDLNDQVRNGLIESYTVKGNHPELSMDEIAQIIKK